jgi:hypothetical protein
MGLVGLLRADRTGDLVRLGVPGHLGNEGVLLPLVEGAVPIEIPEALEKTFAVVAHR